MKRATVSRSSGSRKRERPASWTGMTRRPDWPERLAEVVAAAMGRHFAWGEHDCALFACDCAAAMTGEDPGLSFRGRYKTARGAAGAIMRYGKVRGIEELALRTLGAPIEPAFARRGDVVLVDTDLGPALGVVTAAGAAFPGPDGLTFLPITEALKAWRV